MSSLENKNRKTQTSGSQKYKLSTMKLKKVIEGSDSFILSVCVLNDGRLASCSYNLKIKVFNLETDKCDLVLKGHRDFVVFVSLLNNGYLASSSYDKTIKIWEINKFHYQCIKTLKGCKDYIFRTIQLSNNRMGSCSLDKTIRIWNSNFPFNCITILRRHTDWVISLIELRNREYLVSGGNDKTIRFWCNSTYKNKYSIRNVMCETNSLLEVDNNLLLAGEGNVLTIINTLTLQVETKIFFQNDFKCISSLLQMKDLSLICGCECMIIQLDINKGTVLDVKNNAHSRGIVSLFLLNEEELISCSYKSIKIWDFN